MTESVFAYRKRRFLWLSLGFLSLLTAVYVLHDPQEPPNGGTLLGYTLGGVATAIVLLLTWFGVRKRRYRATRTSVQGWLSLHIYLGLVLPFIVLLHSGFQLGVNVHTLAFLLLLLVVVSGVIGAYFYARYPALMSRNRGGASREELLAQLADLDDRSKRAAAGLGDEFRDVIASGIARTQLGGRLLARLTGRDESQVVLPSNGRSNVVPNRGQEALLDWLADRQAYCNDAGQAAAVAELSALLRNKRKLLKTLSDDMRFEARLSIWLYAHVPLTAATLAAVAAHILSVFIYW